MIDYKIFSRKFLIIPMKKLLAHKFFPCEMLILPKDSVIHFIPESPTLLGIENNEFLIKGYADTGKKILVYHIHELRDHIGNVSKKNANFNNLVREYHKKHHNMGKIVDLNKSGNLNNMPLVVNYALLDKLYKYTNNMMVTYQEWYNLRSTMWEAINFIVGEKHHFIQYKLPLNLPTKQQLFRYSESFNAQGLEVFYSTEHLNLLELWRMLDPDCKDSFDNYLSIESLEKVHIVFVESGQFIIIRLQELLEWVKEDDAAINKFYVLLQRIFNLRTGVDLAPEDNVLNTDNPENINLDIKEVIKKEEDKGINTKLISIIEEHGMNGNLSQSEQKSLIKLSQKIHTMPDPINKNITIGEIKVTKEDTKITLKNIMNDNVSIIDKSMLESKLRDFDKNYVNNVYHKDIVQMFKTLPDVGVLIKKVDVKDTHNAVTKAREYSIQLQPVIGEASTLKVKVPIIEEDGTFKTGNVRYRMNKQKSDLPIVKAKAYMVALSSYYGKSFVFRNQNTINNIAKWLCKKINLKVLDGAIKDVIRGQSPRVDIHLPRIYSAIAENFMGFSIGDDRFYWNLKKIDTIFTKEEIEQLKKDDLIPCGHSSKGVLGMDSHGVIYEHQGNKNVMLKHITLFIDENINDPPHEYSEISIFSKRIPLGIAFSYIYGLDDFLRNYNIPFTVEPSSKRLDLDNQNYFYIKFKDLTYIVNIRKHEHELLIAGWGNADKTTRLYNSSAFNKKTVYSSLLSSSGITGSHFKELKLMWDMYLDPITKEILLEMKEPTEFDKLLLRANELLVNDNTPRFTPSRIKGYERVPGILYESLVKAVRTYRNTNVQSKAMVSINPNEVWLEIIKDPSVGLIEESNPLHNLKESETVTVTGKGGRSTETMVKETRGFKDDDLGVFSEASPDSGTIGIRTYLSANANINNVRGMTDIFDNEKHGPASVLSTTALISPGITHDDGIIIFL